MNTNFFNDDLSPEPPSGDHIGGTPYPFNDIADVIPKAPSEHVGASPYPIGASDVQPAVTDHKSYDMPMHRAQPKPGSFHDSPPSEFNQHDGPDQGW